ncbi:MAG: site-2 protease family protein [Candidatus Magasanikbacteria bacterium]|nr:site-2 protease family protein [Candidatus Magasanikbacteria bacterium]
MIFTLLIAFISLVGLMIIHEFGHFIIAKKFGVKVEEFGIGYPPRLYGKKFGETIYSLNLLPFGAFVRIYGQEERIENPRSFSGKPFWQKALIILGGVISFWIVSAILLSIVMALGTPTIIEDEENHNLVNPKVQIVAIAPNSPAEKAGIKIGDTITNIKYQVSNVKIDKVKDFQEFISTHKGQEVILTIQRGKENIDISLVPRASPPSDEGPIGIALVRTALKSFPWYIAPIEGVKATANLTIAAVKGWGNALINLINRRPTGVQLMGPVGVFDLFTQVSQLGLNYFLQFVAIISIFVALFNILPIPVTDGGKFLILVIEKIRGKAINQKIEQNIDIVSFALLLILMVWITIKDISRLF